jgi:hypothetical protein
VKRQAMTFQADKSLTKSEKFFKKICCKKLTRRQEQLYNLFDAIESTDSYDDET